MWFMLSFMTILVMFIVAYAYFREGMFTAFAMLVNVLLAGLITFNFWEPLAGSLDNTLQGSFLNGYQDFVIIMILYAVTLGILRMVTHNLAYSVIEFSPTLQQFGGAGVGLITGYLLSGFLICALETLPWHKNFMDFEPKTRTESEFRRMLPADRIWLALMRHAGAYGFARGAVPGCENADSPYDRYATFDQGGTFEQRYYRYRRYSDSDDPMPYLGELDNVLMGPVNVPLPPSAPPATVPAVSSPAQTNPPPAPAKTPDGKGDKSTPPPGKEVTPPGK
jgi:hypothetical protein